MVERIDSAPRVSPRRSFAMGALWGLVAAGFVFPVLAVFNREMYPAQAQAMVVYAAAICLASAVAGGVRSMLLARAVAPIRRLTVGGLGGAVMGSIFGLGLVLMWIGESGRPPLSIIGWSAGSFAFLLGLLAIDTKEIMGGGAR
jgi:hypothetical protein